VTDPVRLACRTEVVEIPLAKILPMRLLGESVGKTSKYRCIAASIRELNLIEPLVVFPQPDSGGCYMLLDGHVRHKILKDMQVETAKCLIAFDDEGYTYNHKLNRLSAIQEHFMILRAIEHGVDEEKIARTLNIDLAQIRRKRDMLDGICPEAVSLLREKQVTANGLRELRKVKPMRQIAVAEVLCSSHNYSLGYIKCLVATSADEEFVNGDRVKEAHGLSPEDIARMEHETETLGREFKLIEQSHGKNTLDLVLVVGYLRKLVENARVARYFSQRHPEILIEFQKLVESRSLADGPTAKPAID
jgi:hypothetical protein